MHAESAEKALVRMAFMESNARGWHSGDKGPDIQVLCARVSMS